jgi:hypothetical protein
VKTVQFDHYKLVRRKKGEVKRYCRFLWAAKEQIEAGGPPPAVEVLHEHDNKCCRIEGWTKTQLAMSERAGLLVVEVRQDDTPDRRMSQLDEI